MTTADDNLKINFGRRVREFRDAQGYSQDHLADVSGLHRTYIVSIESGKRNVSLKNIVRIAEALNVDPGRLIRGLTFDRG